jgi:YegS/Rv2252/BmrU family lipid kinase
MTLGSPSLSHKEETQMLSTMAVIFNQDAGLGNHHEDVQRAVKAMQHRGMNIRLIRLASEKPWKEQIDTLLAEGVDTLVAAGGDGTVNSIASCLLDTDCRLGVVPTGTVNHFAKHIGMPLDVASALDVIGCGHTERIDVGELNGIPFLNFSSLGLYADILTTFVERQRLGWPKRLALLRAVMDIVRPYPPLHIGFAKGTKETQVRTPLVFIGNNRYDLGGFDLLQACDGLRSGILQVAYLHNNGRSGLLRLFMSALFRHGQRQQDITVTGLSAFQITSQQDVLPVAIDGEVRMMPPPLHYAVRPQSLRVIVPKA